MTLSLSMIIVALIGAGILTYYYDRACQRALKENGLEKKQKAVEPVKGSQHFGLSLISFLFPIFGFVYGFWLKATNKKPQVAKICLEFALVGFLTNLMLLILYWPF